MPHRSGKIRRSRRSGKVRRYRSRRNSQKSRSNGLRFRAATTLPTERTSFAEPIPTLAQLSFEAAGLETVKWGEYVDGIVMNIQDDGTTVATKPDILPDILKMKATHPNPIEITTYEMGPADLLLNPVVLALRDQLPVTVKGIVLEAVNYDSGYVIATGYDEILFDQLPDPQVEEFDQSDMRGVRHDASTSKRSLEGEGFGQNHWHSIKSDNSQRHE